MKLGAAVALVLLFAITVAGQQTKLHRSSSRLRDCCSLGLGKGGAGQT
jgi:hypothetical protein